MPRLLVPVGSITGTLGVANGGTGTATGSIQGTGDLVFRPGADTATGIQLAKTGAGASILTVDTTNGDLHFTGTIAQTASRVTQSYHTNITSTNAVTVDSDERWKTNISDTYGLDVVNAIPARSFVWREDSGRADGVRHHGFVAQEVQGKLEEAGISNIDLPVVIYDEDADEYGMRSGELIPILWTAVQQLSRRLSALEQE